MRLGNYGIHPAAEIFPLLDDDDLKSLADDILHHGLREPIVLTADGKTLVDGRNRYRACDMLNLEPAFRRLGTDYTDAMIIDYVVSANVKRRHLNPGQLAFVAVELEPMYAKAAKERQREGGRSAAPGRPAEKLSLPVDEVSPLDRQATAQAAAAVGSARSTVAQAKAVERDAPDLAKKVRTGEKTLKEADRERRQRNKSMPKPDSKPKPHRADPILLTLNTHDGSKVKYPMPQSKPQFNETPGEGISWATWSWNPVTGCLHGCAYCYAREIATSRRFADAYPIGFTPLFHHERLTAPANTAIPSRYRDDNHRSCMDGGCQICAYRRVFVCSMADLYGRWVPQDWIEQIHAAMLDSPQWQYITLTKFPDRYPGLKLPEGAWIGTSVDEQKRVRIAERAFSKLSTDVVKWLSLEPLREPLKFDDLSMFDWVVIGAQTETRQPDGVVPAFGPPMEWVSSIVSQAREAGCAVHCKPNLIGETGPNKPGMQLPNEYPIVSRDQRMKTDIDRRQHDNA